MSGASPAHETVILNLATGLRNKLRGRSCRIFLSNTRLKVPAYPPYRYPALTALCGKPKYESIGGVEVLTNPSLIVEVLSPSTEAFDRGDKFTRYKSIPSFSEYLLIAQHRPHITHYAKQADGSWSYEEANDLTTTIHLSSLDCDLMLNELYEDVDFATAERSVPPRKFDELL
jgi:Uma2 family endonuclease